MKGQWSMMAKHSVPPLRRSIFSSIALGALAVAASAFLFACSRTDQTVRPNEKITVAYALLPETALIQVAQVKGQARREGLEVAARLHSYGRLALKDVLEGKADFATVAETPVMFAIMNGEKIFVIATIQSSNKNHALVARKDMGIITPPDLKGRKIGTTLGITADFFMGSFLATHGISTKEVTVVNLKPEEHESALADGHVDAVSTFYPFLRRAQNRLGAKGITFYEKDIYTETFHVVATQEFVRKNPDKTQKMLRALVQAEEFVRNNPEEAQRIVADLSKIDLNMLRDVWADNEFRVSLDQSLILALEDESKWAIKNGLAGAKRIPNYLDFVYFDGLRAVKPEVVRILK